MRKKALSISVVLVILFGVAIFILPSSPFRSKAGVTLNISNPYKNYPNNVKVNFHDHSNVSSGGADTPVNVGNWYKNSGYKGYSISDEQKMTPNPNVAGIAWLGLAEEQSVAGKELLHINGKTNQTGTNLQTSVDTIKSQGGKSIALHPNGTTTAEPGWDNASLVNVNNLLGIEVYNPKNGSIATSKWDYALSKGKKYWGFAFDDSKTATERGKGLIIVNTSSATPSQSDILNQIYAGNFYASSRPSSTANFYDIKVTQGGSYNNNLSFATTTGTKIRLIKAGATDGTTIVTAGRSTTYAVKGDEKYVRAEVLDANGRAVAWSQPVYISQTTTTTGTGTTPQASNSSASSEMNIPDDSTTQTEEVAPEDSTVEEVTAEEPQNTDETVSSEEESNQKTTVAGNKKFNIYIVIGTVLLLLIGIGTTVFFYLKRRSMNQYAENVAPLEPSEPETPAGSFLANAESRMENMTASMEPAVVPIENQTVNAQPIANPMDVPVVPVSDPILPVQPITTDPNLPNPSNIDNLNPVNPLPNPPENPPGNNTF